MGFEPQKFFIGLIDFFAVILPGALLTFLLADDLGPRILGDRYAELHGNSRTIAFVIASYLTGHFVFLVASLVLDNVFYERVRRATPIGRVRALAAGKPWPSWLAHLFAHISGAHRVDRAEREAELLKDRHLARDNAQRSINAFQWAKARLVLAHPEASAAVERFEADSKFFRSLVVVLLVWAAWGAAHSHATLVVLGCVLSLFAFVRYVDQRMKATRQAYWFVIALEGEEERDEGAARSDVTHAGGVVVRGAAAISRETEALLVRSTDGKAWVLPKGHIESAERAAETAVREVSEETGCWARVKCRLADIDVSADGSSRAAIFLMKYERDVRSREARHRRPEWCRLGEAIEKATFPETKELLRGLLPPEAT